MPTPVGSPLGVLSPCLFLRRRSIRFYRSHQWRISEIVLDTRHSPPEYWSHSRYPKGKENEPVVLVNFHDASGYCRFIGKRLPTVDEWKSTCEGGQLKKRGDIWEWTSTDVDLGGQTYKALCGPGNSCDCSHRYLPEWKNDVKGFRCVQDQTPVTWLPMLFQGEVFL